MTTKNTTKGHPKPIYRPHDIEWQREDEIKATARAQHKHLFVVTVEEQYFVLADGYVEASEQAYTLAPTTAIKSIEVMQ